MAKQLSILALEPYYGGSHKAFIDNWLNLSRHDWTLLTLPAHHWKWRMRHSAFFFAEEISRLFYQENKRWDIIWCSSITNLAELIGLLPVELRVLPSVIYFHENQLTYPIRKGQKRDFQTVFTNFTSALSANSVWFNSAFNRDSFLDKLSGVFKQMADFRPYDGIETIRAKSLIQHPGIELPELNHKANNQQPLKILWAARWEHDKCPEIFFEAIETLEKTGLDYRLMVIGESFRDSPEIFTLAQEKFASRIDRWGYLESKAEYFEALSEADVAVSSAGHEFFGIGMLEAVVAGARPLMPEKLAYPEIFRNTHGELCREFFYDGSSADLADKLSDLAKLKTQSGSVWDGSEHDSKEIALKFVWSKRAEAMDSAIASILD
jgi:glycosyltransferase involved in cell wall biosynthesis